MGKVLGIVILSLMYGYHWMVGRGLGRVVEIAFRHRCVLLIAGFFLPVLSTFICGSSTGGFNIMICALAWWSSVCESCRGDGDDIVNMERGTLVFINAMNM